MAIDRTPNRLNTLLFALLMITSTFATGLQIFTETNLENPSLTKYTGNGTTSVEYVIAGTDYTDYDVSDTVHAESSSYDLTIGQNYSLYWTLTASTINSTIDSGNFSWTALGNWSQETINWSGLSVDWYCFNVDLYEDNATGSHWLDSDNACFSVEDGNQSGGNQTTYYEWLNIWPDNHDYNVVSGTPLTIHYEAGDLVTNITYLIELHISNSSWIGDWNMTFTANASNWSSGLLLSNFGLSDGCYYVAANLYDNADNHYFSNDTFTFCVVQPPSYVIAGTDYTDYDVNDTVHAEASSYDLTIGQHYSLYWTLTASTINSTIDSGNFSWTAFGNWNQETINWSGLSVDWYCFNVDLYEDNATGSHWLDSDNACFSVEDGNQSGGNQTIYEWINIWPTNHDYNVSSGTPLTIHYEAGDLVTNITYRIEWSVHSLASSSVVSGNMTFTANANWSGGLLESNISLNDDCYDVWADLYDDVDGHHFSYDYFYFCVESQNNPYVIVGTDYTDYDVGDTVHAEASSYDLTIGQHYSLYWTLTASSATNSTIDSGDFSWTALGNWSQETINWNGLGEDWYCFNVDLYEDSNGSNATGSPGTHWLDSDNACFSVEYDGNITGNEELIIWPDGHDYTIEVGDNLDVLYEVDNLYANGSYVIEWDISDENVTVYSGSLLIDPASSTIGWSQYMIDNASYLFSEDCYVVWAGLYVAENGTLLVDDSFILCVEDPLPVDTDGDGIPDVDDLCPGTPAGTAVDSVGCPELPTTGNEALIIWPGGHDYTIEVGDNLDVLYEVDNLSVHGSYLIEWDISTVALGTFDSGSLLIDPTSSTIGWSQYMIDNVSYVFSAGCYEVWSGLYENGTLLVDDSFILCVEDPLPVDTDGDGILDADDQCPGTPVGTAVDSVGCPEPPADSDGDGVSDDDDLCPGTPAGTAVDSVGCPETSTPYILVDYTMDERVVMFEGQNITILADEGWATVSIEVGNLVPSTNYVLEWVVEDFSTVPPAELGCSNWPSTTPPGPCAGEMPLPVVAGLVTWGIHFPVLEDSSNACFSIRLLSDDGSELASHNGTCWAQESQADWDSDGVKDVLDECGDTPIGTAVDSVGCPELTDSDDETGGDAAGGLVPGFTAVTLSISTLMALAFHSRSDRHVRTPTIREELTPPRSVRKV